MQPVSRNALQQSALHLRGLRLRHLLRHFRPFRWFWIAILYAIAISLIHGMQAWQHYTMFQEMGFASRHNSSWFSKLVTWSGLPGALPAYVVSAFSPSVVLAICGYLLGMLLVYGAAGLLADGLTNMLRFFRAVEPNSTIGSTNCESP